MTAVEVLIAVNVLIFLFTLTDPELIIRTLGLQPTAIFRGERLWGLVTNMFVHASFDHILFNMIALFFFGMYVERLIGERNFWIVYFTGGFCADLIYLITSLVGLTNPYIIGVGASGAIFAIMGVLVVLRPNMTILIGFFIPMPLYIFAILYTMFAVFILFQGMPGGIAHNAHLGGLLAGLVFGRHFKEKNEGDSDPYHIYY